MTSRESALKGLCCLRRFGLAACLAVAIAIVFVGRLFGDETPALKISYDRARPVSGTLFICGGGKLDDDLLAKFVEYAGGAKAHLAIITTASETADSEEVESRIEYWRRLNLTSLDVLHTRSRETADDAEFCKPLAVATGVWFIGGHQHRLTDAYLGTRAQQMIRGVLERGGVVGGTSAGAAIMSPLMIRGGIQAAEVGEGFGLLPGTVIDQHFLKRKRQDRLLGVLSNHPRLVGFGIDESTVLIVQGRKLSVMGDSNVVACLAAIGDKPPVIRTLEPGDEEDLLALSRTAFSRVQPRTQRDKSAPALEVPHGTVVVAGGGEIPDEAARRFIEAAGGPNAKIVVVTTAHGDQPPSDAEALNWLTDAGARNVQRLHARTPREAEAPSTLELLRQAGGVWFIGGRQWRLVDAYLDTAAEKEFHNVLTRGGSVGGTGAGASMLAGYLVRGNPLSNNQVMSDGYDEGFGFLAGAAIDPFFTKRNRFADMAQLKRVYPQLLGVGVDHSTALIVHGTEISVVGQNHVALYDRLESAEKPDRTFELLYAGDRYDLASRQRIGPPRTDPTVAADSTPVDDDDPEPQPPLACDE